ncbi:MAG TPA: response regulator [Patescibacteria group bacterium]|nr:response regulator [Patescibacteria group bacterium]
MSQTFLAGKSVLVADDEKFSRQIIIHHLRDFGDPQIEQAASGSEALVILSDPAKKCDVVILDVVMPGVNGLTVLKAIRVGFNSIRRDMPVIMLTGNSDADLVSSALLLDVDAFVVKPVSKVGLSTRLAKALEENRDMRSAADYAAVPTEKNERKAEALIKAAERQAQEPEGVGPGRLVPVTDLLPGAVLARDLCNSARALVLPAGVTLTARYILRLRELASVDVVLGRMWVE